MKCKECKRFFKKIENRQKYCNKKCTLRFNNRRYRKSASFKRLKETKDFKLRRRFATTKCINKDLIPKWANLDKIKKIYMSSNGQQVKHIIPLRKNKRFVTGFHNEFNLELLPLQKRLELINQKRQIKYVIFYRRKKIRGNKLIILPYKYRDALYRVKSELTLRKVQFKLSKSVNKISVVQL